MSSIFFLSLRSDVQVRPVFLRRQFPAALPNRAMVPPDGMLALPTISTVPDVDAMAFDDVPIPTLPPVRPLLKSVSVDTVEVATADPFAVLVAK